MAINIIERAVTPYNSSASKVSNKEQYSLYAPAANVNKPGMAGYDPRYFAVREQIVELSAAFLASILHHRPADEVAPDGIKESNTVYSNFTHEVLDYRTPVGTEVKSDVTGNLFVFRDGETVITEILFAHGRIWSRELTVDGLDVMSVGQFEPAYDNCVTHDELAVDAVETENIRDANVTTEKLDNSAVTTEKLDNFAVTTNKIDNLAVTTGKIEDSAVTTKKLDDSAVTTRKLYNFAVTTNKIDNLAVTTEKLADGNVTENKIVPSHLRRVSNLEAGAFQTVTFNAETGTLTFTSATGRTETVDLPTEEMLSDVYFDEGSENDDVDDALVFIFVNGREVRVPTSAFLADLLKYVQGVHESIYVLQKAPPLAVINKAILLSTPTIAQISAQQEGGF